MDKQYYPAKIVFLTMHNSNYLKLSNITLPNKKIYCHKHGYNLIVKTNNWRNIPIGYEKAYLIKDAFEKYPECKWAFFSECDTLITNMDIKLDDIVKDEQKDVVITSDLNGINVGSFFVKNSPNGLKFIYDMIDSIGKNTHEQEFIQNIYASGNWQNIISLYPQKVFNSYKYNLYPAWQFSSTVEKLLEADGNWTPGDFMIHTPGYPMEKRIPLLESLNNQIINTDYLLKRDIKTFFGNYTTIRSNNQEALAHFSSHASYADFIIDQINLYNLYEKYLNKKNLVIFDFGGNIGLFSLHASECASIIYSFEPTPEHFNLLVEFTKGFDNIKPVNAAISDKDSDITFYKSSENTTMNSLINKYGEELVVKGRSILSFINENNIKRVDFIKCDIEGGEMIALTEDTVKPLYGIVSEWFIEVHSTPGCDTTENRYKLKFIFEKAGYKCELIGADTLYVYS